MNGTVAGGRLRTRPAAQPSCQCRPVTAHLTSVTVHLSLGQALAGSHFLRFPLLLPLSLHTGVDMKLSLLPWLKWPATSSCSPPASQLTFRC